MKSALCKLLKKKEIKYHIKVIKKPYFHYIPCMNYKDLWMFFNQSLTQIDIFSPTLDNLKMMSDYGLTLVVKGFNSFSEYKYFDNLRVRYGTSAMMCAYYDNCKEVMEKAFISYCDGEPLPTKEEVEEIINKNKLKDVDDVYMKRKAMRDFYYKKVLKYQKKVWNAVGYLLSQKRIEKLNIVI